jgi:class 3 adenylate cyclase
MPLLDDLTKETDAIVKSAWKYRDGTVVPETSDLALGNEAVKLEATFLYADLADSTELAVGTAEIAAEVFKAYLMGTTRIIRALGGEVRSFDGDRVMGVFLEGAKNTAAAEAALKINYFFSYILRPAFTSFYAARSLSLTQTVGVDTSNVSVVRSGIRNNNDLVWVGRAPNLAAKLSAIRNGYSTLISKTVFDIMLDPSKISHNDFAPPNTLMWKPLTWAAGKAYGVETVYGSTWWWKP